jgi:hypothetical protein
MNLGLTTSFIVAGILLLSILSMNMNLSQSSTQLTMRQITETKSNTINEILGKDIPNIGYKEIGALPYPIKDAQEGKIKFEGDIDNDGSEETVIWEYNGSDNTLTRDVVGGTETTFKNVSNFEIEYLDSNRNTISPSLISTLLGGTKAERDKIRFIDISYTLQSQEKVGGLGSSNPEYIEVTWQKQFTPLNLRF